MVNMEMYVVGSPRRWICPFSTVGVGGGVGRGRESCRAETVTKVARREVKRHLASCILTLAERRADDQGLFSVDWRASLSGLSK